MSKHKQITFTLPLEEFTSLLNLAESEQKSRHAKARELLIKSLNRENLANHYNNSLKALQLQVKQLKKISVFGTKWNMRATQDDCSQSEYLKFLETCQKLEEEMK